MPTQEKIQAIADKIVKEFQPERIILFGSYAWGKPGPDSDVDLFIVKETEKRRELARRIDRSLFPRPFPIDVIVYRKTRLEERARQGDFFVQDILDNGKILYKKTAPPRTS